MSRKLSAKRIEKRMTDDLWRGLLGIKCKWAGEKLKIDAKILSDYEPVIDKWLDEHDAMIVGE